MTKKMNPVLFQIIAGIIVAVISSGSTIAVAAIGKCGSSVGKGQEVIVPPDFKGQIIFNKTSFVRGKEATTDLYRRKK